MSLEGGSRSPMGSNRSRSPEPSKRVSALAPSPLAVKAKKVCPGLTEYDVRAAFQLQPAEKTTPKFIYFAPQKNSKYAKRPLMSPAAFGPNAIYDDTPKIPLGGLDLKSLDGTPTSSSSHGARTPAQALPVTLSPRKNRQQVTAAPQKTEVATAPRSAASETPAEKAEPKYPNLRNIVQSGIAMCLAFICYYTSLNLMGPMLRGRGWDDLGFKGVASNYIAFGCCAMFLPQTMLRLFPTKYVLAIGPLGMFIQMGLTLVPAHIDPSSEYAWVARLSVFVGGAAAGVSQSLINVAHTSMLNEQSPKRILTKYVSASMIMWSLSPFFSGIFAFVVFSSGSGKNDPTTVIRLLYLMMCLLLLSCFLFLGMRTPVITSDMTVMAPRLAWSQMSAKAVRAIAYQKITTISRCPFTDPKLFRFAMASWARVTVGTQLATLLPVALKHPVMIDLWFSKSTLSKALICSGTGHLLGSLVFERLNHFLGTHNFLRIMMFVQLAVSLAFCAIENTTDPSSWLLAGDGTPIAVFVLAGFCGFLFSFVMTWARLTVSKAFASRNSDVMGMHLFTCTIGLTTGYLVFPNLSATVQSIIAASAMTLTGLLCWNKGYYTPDDREKKHAAESAKTALTAPEEAEHENTSGDEEVGMAGTCKPQPSTARTQEPPSAFTARTPSTPWTSQPMVFGKQNTTAPAGVTHSQTHATIREEQFSMPAAPQEPAPEPQANAGVRNAGMGDFEPVEFGDMTAADERVYGKYAVLGRN